MRKVYRLQVLVYSFLFLILSTVTCTLYPTFAAESTPSADIRVKLEELKKEIASKAAKLKQEINKKLNNKAYVGKVKIKSDQTLTVATNSGPKIVNINQDTVFDTEIQGKKYSQKAVAEEDYLAALGDIDEVGVLTAKKVVLLPSSDSQPKTYQWGQVVSVSEKLLNLKTSSLKSVSVTFSKIPNVKIGDFVVLTGVFNEEGVFEKEFIFVLPQNGVLKPKKAATSSSEISTPGAKPK